MASAVASALATGCAAEIERFDAIVGPMLNELATLLRADPGATVTWQRTSERQPVLGGDRLASVRYDLQMALPRRLIEDLGWLRYDCRGVRGDDESAPTRKVSWKTMQARIWWPQQLAEDLSPDVQSTFCGEIAREVKQRSM